MWRLSFWSEEGAWVDSVAFNGCEMLAEPFDNRDQVEKCVSALHELWPDLRVRVSFVDED